MTTFDATIGRVTQLPVNFASLGDNIIVPGIARKSLNILQFFLVFGAATTVTFKSGAVAISGPMPFVLDGSFVLDYIQLPITCSEGDNFVMNLSVGAQVSGMIWYSVK